ncbi:osmotically inducible protein OsmC [Streptomyces sp. V4I23]|nr:osmotically inducible protein OsmC [Streptomyces sp. V4I23]
MAVSYTAVVTVDGEGRNGGRVRSGDGLLQTTLAVPKELVAPVTPPIPSSCSRRAGRPVSWGAVRRAAAGRKVSLTSTAVTAEITLNHGDDGEFGLAAVIDVELGGVDQKTATELGAAAHRICPYSKATRGNIPVTVKATAA